MTVPTGLALIYRVADGETQIVVVPGANALFGPREVEGAVLCQLEVTDAVVTAAAARASFFALNAAPVRPLPLEPDLLVVNRLEYEVAQGGRLVAVTDGAAGAVLYEGGVEVARRDRAAGARRRRHRRRRRLHRLPGGLAARRAPASGGARTRLRGGSLRGDPSRRARLLPRP